MAENLSSLDPIEKESFTDEQKLASLEAGVIVCSKSMSDLMKEIGFAKSLKSFCVRSRYIRRLWLIREVRILQILCENYEKVPAWTISKVCAWLLVTFPVLRLLTVKLEKDLKQRLITNPWRGLTMNSKEIDKKLVDSFKGSHNIK